MPVCPSRGCGASAVPPPVVLEDGTVIVLDTGTLRAVFDYTTQRGTFTLTRHPE